MNYLVISALSLALMYGVFRLALNRTTLHRFNRTILLSILALSAVLPAVRIEGLTPAIFIKEEPLKSDMPVMADAILPAYLYAETQDSYDADEPALNTRPTAPQTAVQAEPASDVRNSIAATVRVMESLMQMDLQSVITYLYLMIAAFFMIRLLVGITRAETLCRLGGRMLPDGIRLLVCDGDFQPTSWRGTIIISRRDYESENSAMILEHEKAHIRRHHSVDVILAQLMCALQWFNPAAWALKRSLQEVHEYQADAAVLADGEDLRHYQVCLVQAALGSRVGYVTSNFADCSTKKRITMMRTNQSSPFVCLRALFLLPAVGLIILLSSACKSDTNKDSSLAGSDEAVTEQLIAETPVAEPDSKSEPFDTAAFLNKYPRPMGVYMTDKFVVVEDDGSIWITYGGFKEFYPATLSNFERELERVDSVKVPNPERMHIIITNKDRLGVCVQLAKKLEKKYSPENISVLEGAPLLLFIRHHTRYGYNMDTEKDRCVLFNVNANNSIQYTAWNTSEGKKSEGKVGSAQELKAVLERLFPNAGQKVLYGIEADQKSSFRVSEQIDNLLAGNQYINADWNKGPVGMTRQDSIDYIIFGKDGSESGRKRHVKNMKWYNENKDKEEFFRMGFKDGKLCVCKGNDPSKLQPIEFDQLVPYFKANCPDGNERSAIVLFEIVDTEGVSVEFIDKVLDKMESWITTFTRRLYLSPKHIE